MREKSPAVLGSPKLGHTRKAGSKHGGPDKSSRAETNNSRRIQKYSSENRVGNNGTKTRIQKCLRRKILIHKIK